MPHVEVRPRVVAPPWERKQIEGQRRTYVGREAGVLPERGPLDLYRSRWPTRDVRWNFRRQLFEITDREDRAFRELVFQYDAEKEGEDDRTPEELTEMVRLRHPAVARVFRPFDYDFVETRLREADEFDSIGRSFKREVDRLIESNKAVQRRLERSVAGNYAAGINEIRRYLPQLAGEEKIPLVPGATFTH